MDIISLSMEAFAADTLAVAAIKYASAARKLRQFKDKTKNQLRRF